MAGFLGVIFTSAWRAEDVFREIAQGFGPLGLKSLVYDFELTDYYEHEMGKNLSRVFCALPGLVPADRMLTVRDRARAIESVLSLHGRRTVNLDPGYLDAFKVVLLSDKYSGRKIYVGQGCYADVTLEFDSGRWRSVRRAFPDFRHDRYHSYFLELRQHYLRELKDGARRATEAYPGGS